MTNTILVLIMMFLTTLLFANSKTISRADFPTGFTFGTASSAYQFEGAVDEGNKGDSIWDTFIRQPGRIVDFSNADTAVDQYHRFKGDIDLMKDLGMDAYRFSISWPRIFPNGTGVPNQEGINYYNCLIDSLLEKGIQPFVTLYHWDLPQMLEDKYEGWLSKQIVDDFEHYAFTCFQAFGDRVKHWITFNEPHGFSIQGYDTGVQAPGRCSIMGHILCKRGNSSSEPYIVSHNILLSHAAAYRCYQLHFKVLLSSLWQRKLLSIKTIHHSQLELYLDETNYSLWPQLMEMRIGARNKAGYLTGATEKPDPTDPRLDTLIIENHRAKS